MTTITRPEWLDALRANRAATSRAPAPPAWVGIDSLPGLVIAAHVADGDEVLAILQAMPELSPGLLPGNRGFAVPMSPPAWVEKLRLDAEPTTLDVWVHALHERFHAADRPANGRWVYMAVAVLGGDRCALKVGAQVRQMAEDLNRVGANLGIELLKAIGTDTAIMQLDLLRRKVRRDSVRIRAQQAVDAIAAQRGLTLDALADRVIPDCGLDAQGGRCFDYGTRRFWFTVGAALVPQVRDEAGVVRDNLPTPRASDDSRMAAESIAAWKLLKKSLKDTLKLQADRLELAMIQGRTWSPDEFRHFFADHPAMRHLARLLVWGTGGADSRAGFCFRIAEDRTLCDENDEPCAAPPAGGIRIMHPLHLDPTMRAKWGQVLSDYDVVPPFDQINRLTFALEPAETSSRLLSRFKGCSVHAMSLLSKLTRLGWTRDDTEDSGCIAQHRKTYVGGVTAILRHNDGIPIYDPRAAEPQVLDACVFLPEHEITPNLYGLPKGMLLSEVPPVVFSETVRDLTLLTSGSQA